VIVCRNVYILGRRNDNPQCILSDVHISTELRGCMVHTWFFLFYPDEHSVA
jgi:hypothetical protein